MLEQENNSTFESRYKTLLEGVNAAVFLTTFDGEILEANHKSCDLLGYSLDDLTQLSLKDVFPDNYDWAQFKDEISAKGGIHIESENIRKDGSSFPVEISASIFTFEKKPVMIALIWDITERKKAEKQLKESEEKYSGLFECTTDGMLVLDPRGEILDVNNKAQQLFGSSKDDFLGKNFLNMGFLTPKSLSIVVNQFQDLLSKKIATSQETEILDKNGKMLSVELTSFFLVKKANEVDNFVLLIRDITDRKQAEIRLAREHTLLQTLMDSIPDSIYFKDTKNKFIKVNKAKAARYNVKPEEMIGKTDFDFLPEDIAKNAFDDDEEVLKTGKFIINKVEKLTNPDGSERWVSVTKIPRFDPEGNILGTMGISRDITEWKKLEEMYKKENSQKL